MLGGRSALISLNLSSSQFYICLYGREGDRVGRKSVSYFGLLALESESFSLFPIHLNESPRNPIYHLLWVFQDIVSGRLWRGAVLG